MLVTSFALTNPEIFFRPTSVGLSLFGVYHGWLGKYIVTLASYVLAKASDGYQVAFTPGEIDPSFGNQTILIADHRDGVALSGNQGSLRLVVPNDHEGARSVRMLETLEFVRLRK